MKNAAKLVINKWPQLRGALGKLVKNEVLVGVPAEDNTRENDPEEQSGMNNATIAYLMDNGSPANNVPARPFMHPGIKAVQPQITDRLGMAAKRAVTTEGDVEHDMQKVGMIAQSSIRNLINSGISPALQPGTIANRFRQRKTKGRRKGEKEYLKNIGEGMSAEEAQSATGIIPLVNTGQLRNSINYVIRKK